MFCWLRLGNIQSTKTWLCILWARGTCLLVNPQLPLRMREAWMKDPLSSQQKARVRIVFASNNVFVK